MEFAPCRPIHRLAAIRLQGARATGTSQQFGPLRAQGRELADNKQSNRSGPRRLRLAAPGLDPDGLQERRFSNCMYASAAHGSCQFQPPG